MIRVDSRGFTLVDGLAILMVVLCIALVGIPRVAKLSAASRDAKRIRDVERLADAIERYFDATGHYPTPDATPGRDGWDQSDDGAFIPALVAEGFLKEPVLDPVNDEAHHYRYRCFAAHECGCEWNRPFFALGITKFEISTTAADHPSSVRCSDPQWRSEFDLVMTSSLGPR